MCSKLYNLYTHIKPVFCQHNKPYIPFDQIPTFSAYFYTLFFWGCSFPFLETQILQGLSHCIFFCKQKKIVIQLKRIKHPKINAYCYCRRPFLDT